MEPITRKTRSRPVRQSILLARSRSSIDTTIHPVQMRDGNHEMHRLLGQGMQGGDLAMGSIKGVGSDIGDGAA